MKPLVDRLGRPWPDEKVEEILLPVWVIELCDEARTAIIELNTALERMSIGADQMAAETNNAMCDALINDSRKLVDKYRG